MSVPLIRFYCLKCLLEGPRTESYRKLPKGQVPCYEDTCPACRSDDVEVFDSRYTRAGVFADEGQQYTN